MWVREKDYDENQQVLFGRLMTIEEEIKKLKQEHCEHLNLSFYNYVKVCIDCRLELERYWSSEEMEKAELLYNKQTAERKLKEANEAIAKTEKKNK